MCKFCIFVVAKAMILNRFYHANVKKGWCVLKVSKTDINYN